MADIILPCLVCGDLTQLACADCAIDSGGAAKPHICRRPSCRNAHERAFHPDQKADFMRVESSVGADGFILVHLKPD